MLVVESIGQVVRRTRYAERAVCRILRGVLPAWCARCQRGQHADCRALPCGQNTGGPLLKRFGKLTNSGNVVKHREGRKISHSLTYDQPQLRPNFLKNISLEATFLYVVEETLFLLFCNSRTTYWNPPRPAGGCIFHPISYFRSRPNRLTTRCQTVSCPYVDEYL